MSSNSLMVATSQSADSKSALVVSKSSEFFAFPEEKVPIFAIKSSKSELKISSDFKRAKEDIEGIARKRLEVRKTRKNEEMTEFRSRSRERANRRDYRVFTDYQEVVCSVEEEANKRSHAKRYANANARREAAELRKWRQRHQEHITRRRDARRATALEALSDLHLEMMGSEDEKVEFDPSFDNCEEKELFVPDLKVPRSASVDAPRIVPTKIFFMEKYDEGKKFFQRIVVPGGLFTPPDMKSFKATCKEEFDSVKVITSDVKTQISGYGEKLLDTPAFKVLKEIFKGDGEKSKMFSMVVSTISFLRLAIVLPPSFMDQSMLSWLHLKACGFGNDVSAMGSLAVSTLTNLLLKMLRLFTEENKARGLKVESYGETIDGFLTGAHNFISHPLISAIRNIIIFMGALHIFEKPVASSIFKHLGKPEGVSIIALLLTALKDISQMIKMGEAWLFGKPGSVDLLGENPLTSALAKLSNHMDMSEYVYSGLPIKGYSERNAYIAELRTHVEALESVIALSVKSDVRKLKADITLRAGRKLLNDFTGAANASFRATPLGIIIPGPPGIGKSHVLKFVAYIHSLVKGRKFKDELIYTRSGDFWEGYMPFSHPYIHYSEPGKMKKSQAMAKGDPINDELLSVIDNLSFPVNMAFKDKGKIYALPEMVLIDTNNKSMNFEVLYENPAAFRRRFIYIEPIVRAAYSRTGEVGGAFNTDAKDASEAGTDAWLFKVSTMKPKNNTESTEVILMQSGTADQLVELLVPIFAKHILYEEEMLKKIASGDMFNKHEGQILKAATIAGCFMENKAKVEDDGSISVHPDSLFAKFQRSGEKIKNNARQAFDEVRQKIFVELDEKKELDIDASALNHKDAVALVQQIIPEANEEKKVEEDFVPVVGISQERDLYLKDLLALPRNEFAGKARPQTTLKELASLLMREYSDEEINAFCYSIGMFSWLKIRIDRGSRTISLMSKNWFQKDFVLNDTVVFTAEHVQLGASPIWNALLKNVSGWEYVWDAWNYCRLHERDMWDENREVLRAEFADPEIFWNLLSSGGYLWLVAVFFMWRLMLSNNLVMGLNISQNKMFFLLLSIACVYMRQFGVWIMFMSVFLSCLYVQDNLRAQGVAILNGCISDACDGLGFNFTQAKSAVTGEPDKTPRKNFWKLKFLGAVCASGLVALGALHAVSAIIPARKEEKVVFVEGDHVPTKSGNENIINVTVVNDSDKNKVPVSALQGQVVSPTMSSETTFSKTSEYDFELIEKEKSYHCGQSYERIANKLEPSKWNVRMIPPPRYTGQPEDFIKLVGFNCRGCIAFDDRTGIQREGHLFGLWDNYAIVHNHAFSGDFRGKLLLVSTTGYQKDENQKIPTYMDETSARALPNDLLLVRLNQIRFQDLRKHMMNFEDLPNFTQGFVGFDAIKALKTTEPITLTDKGRPVHFNRYYSYTWNKHAPGRCGTPVVGQAGKGWVILGIHSAGSDETNFCVASVTHLKELQAAAKSLEDSSLLCPLASVNLQCVVTESPAAKSVSRYVEMHGANYYGKLPGPIVMPGPSKVATTGLNDDNKIDEIFYEVLEHKCETQYGPPPMKGFFRDGEYRDPDVLFAKKVSQQKQPMNRKVLNRCIDEYASRIVKGLKKSKRDTLQPWDIETAINGAVEDVYARAMDLKKASGFGKKGQKVNYFDVEEKETGKWAEMITSLRKEVLETLQDYENGESKGVFFEACLKDEPRDLKKCAMGKTRTFCVSPLVNLIITRMFFGPVYSTMVEQGELFCAAIGTDMHRYAQDLYDRLEGHSPLIMELDYGNYDQTMPYELGWAAGSVVYQVCKRMGYTDAALKILSGLVSDNLHPFVILKKDVFELPGYQPSGKYGTAEDNSMRGVLMLMYIWYIGFEDQTHDKYFFDYVVVYVYGDDVVAAVHPSVAHFFNNITYAQKCEELIGLECTPAAKGSKFTPFVDLQTMMFLKRRFKKHADFDRIVAPLDLDSLIKTLTWHIPSSSISVIEQVTSALDSVIRELFFHCNESQFHEMSNKLYDHCEAHFDIRGKLKRLKFYDIAYATLCSTERPVVEGRQDNKIEELCVEYEELQNHTDLLLAQVAAPAVKAKSANLKTLANSSSDSQDFQGTSQTDLMLIVFRAEYKTLFSRHLNGEAVDLVRLQSLADTIRLLEQKYTFSPDSLKVESAELDIRASNSTETKHENLRDVAGDEPDYDQEEKGFLSFSLNQTDVDLRKYLSRPLLISSGSMALDTPFAVNFDVYNLLLRNADVRSKLRTFAYFRADLKIRITISATQFHQGRIIMGWIPWYNRCPSAQQAMTYVGDTFLPNQYMSTLAIQKTIDLKSNKPAELSVPFIHVEPMCRLFNNSNTVIAAIDDFADFADIGRLFVRSINVPEAVTATATAPYYQIYAWFENVTYTMITGTKMALTLESDERVVGPVEKVASSASKVFDALSKVPTLSAFALPSKMMATGVRDIAAHMGWSRPSLIQDPHRVKNEPFVCAAHTIGGELSHKLTLDPKQEISVDPAAVGTHIDEMTFAHLCAKEQLLSTADWSTSSATMSPFWSVAVHPRALRKSNIDATAIPSPMSMVSSYFGYWHGDITYRFDIVKTSFHKGKFAVVWDPNVPQFNLITNSFKLNSEYIYIVDVQELDNLEVTVKWSFPQAWAAVPNAANAYRSVGNIAGVSPNFGLRSCNGFLSLIPITSLQSPLDKSIHINVYIKSENMHFNVFSNVAIEQPWVDVGDLKIDSDLPVDLKVESNDVGALSPVSITINTAASEYKGISSYHFGEEPLSFRSVLKRYRTFARVSGAGTPVLKITSSVIPPLDPPVGSSVPVYEDDGFLGVLRRCYVGMKGGFKYRIRPIMTTTTSLIYPGNTATVSLETQTSTSAAFVVSSSTNLDDLNLKMVGSTALVPYMQSGLEFEVPFYSSSLFNFSQTTDPAATANYLDPNQIRNWSFAVPTPSVTPMTIAIDVATGEDFMLMHFVSCPMMTIT